MLGRPVPRAAILGASSLRFPAPAKRAGSESSITVGLKVNRDGAEEPTLVVRGHRATSSPLGRFDVSADITHVPCPGEYRFEAAQENSDNGNSIAYGAQIVLFDPESQPSSSKCGIAPPHQPGKVSVTLEEGDRRPFALDARRRGGDLFSGSLSFKRFLECDRPYRLEARFALGAWNRIYSFGVRVKETDISVPGREPSASPC